MTYVFIGPRIREFVEEYTFLSFTRNLCSIYGKKKLLDTATKTGLDVEKTAC